MCLEVSCKILYNMHHLLLNAKFYTDSSKITFEVLTRLILINSEFFRHRSTKKHNSLKRTEVECTKQTYLSGNPYDLYSGLQGVCPFPIPAVTQFFA
jgi:hypothetical protein